MKTQFFKIALTFMVAYLLTIYSVNVLAETPHPEIDKKNSIPIQDKSDKGIVSHVKIYRSEGFGYEVKYPKKWQFRTDYVKQNPRIGLRDFVWIGWLLVQVWDMSLYSYEQLTAPPPGGLDPATVEEKQILIDGYPAKEISYVAVGDAGSGSRDVKEIYILRNNLVYKIECSMDCNQILSSFKFMK